jgi:hypothetical protein
MALTLRSTTTRWIGVLQDLVALDREAIEAYASAIEAIVDEPMTRGTLEAFLREHVRHAEEHERLLRSLGGEPRHGFDRRVLVTERDAYAVLPGTTAVLRLLKANEDVVVHRHQEALRAAGPGHVSDAIRGACNAELRHRAWIAARVDAFQRSTDVVVRPSHA